MDLLPELVIWLFSTLLGLVILWWMEPDRRKAMVLLLITVFPTLLGGPVFLLMVLGRSLFSPAKQGLAKEARGAQ